MCVPECAFVYCVCLGAYVHTWVHVCLSMHMSVRVYMCMNSYIYEHVSYCVLVYKYIMYVHACMFLCA